MIKFVPTLFKQGSSVERIKIEWEKHSLFVPPDRWFHQHFNTGKEPARYLPLTPGLEKGTNIEYKDEDPEIRRLFKKELAKTGAPWRMSPFFPGE